MALPPPVPHPTLVNHQGIIEHPNGSDGWLPAENLVPPPSSPPHRSTTGTLLKRKSIIRAPSTSRKGINGDVNTPPVLSDEELQNRAVSANHNLTPKQRSRIAKSEAKDGKRLSRIIKQEGITGKKALTTAIDELEELQKLQQDAMKSEARAIAGHNKNLSAFQKVEAAYLSAKLRYDSALGELNAETQALETLNNKSRQAADKVQAKSTEVDSIRTTLAVDERERELRLSDLRASAVNGWKS